MADEISFSDPWDIMMNPWDIFMGFDPVLQNQIAWILGLCSLGFFLVTLAVILLLGIYDGYFICHCCSDGCNHGDCICIFSVDVG